MGFSPLLTVVKECASHDVSFTILRVWELTRVEGGGYLRDRSEREGN